MERSSYYEPFAIGWNGLLHVEGTHDKFLGVEECFFEIVRIIEHDQIFTDEDALESPEMRSFLPVLSSLNLLSKQGSYYYLTSFGKKLTLGEVEFPKFRPTTFTCVSGGFFPKVQECRCSACQDKMFIISSYIKKYALSPSQVAPELLMVFPRPPVCLKALVAEYSRLVEDILLEGHEAFEYTSILTIKNPELLSAEVSRLSMRERAQFLLFHGFFDKEKKRYHL